MKSDIRFGECVYCGKTRPVTDDHIPPKNLFAKPRPSDLITVPSCYPCNFSASQDDEYFRLNLVLREDTPEHPAAKQLFRAVIRGLSRPQSTGLRQDLLHRIHEVQRVTPAGLYLGESPAYDVDLSRLDKVASCTLKGLFYHEAGKRLPDEYFAQAFSAAGFVKLTPEKQVQVKRTVDLLLNRPFREVGKRKVFVYWHLASTDDPCITAWLLLFFQRTAFIGFTVPMEPRNAV